MTNRVTIEQQEMMGIRQQNYRAIEPPTIIETTERVIPDRQPTRGEVMPQQPISLSVTPTANVNVDFRTSARDRAIGFLIASVPRTFAFSLAITILSIVVGGVTLATSFVILFGVFSFVELISYVFTLAISAEGTAWMEAKRKWDVIEREQRARWKHYNRLTKGDK